MKLPYVTVLFILNFYFHFWSSEWLVEDNFMYPSSLLLLIVCCVALFNVLIAYHQRHKRSY
jgi:hypothetical protein